MVKAKMLKAIFLWFYLLHDTTEISGLYPISKVLQLNIKLKNLRLLRSGRRRFLGFVFD